MLFDRFYDFSITITVSEGKREQSNYYLQGFLFCLFCAPSRREGSLEQPSEKERGQS